MNRLHSRQRFQITLCICEIRVKKKEKKNSAIFFELLSLLSHTHRIAGTHAHKHTPPSAQIRQWLKTVKCKVKLQLIASIVEKCQRRPCNPAAILERIIPDIAVGLSGSPQTTSACVHARARVQTAVVGHRGPGRPAEDGTPRAADSAVRL